MKTNTIQTIITSVALGLAAGIGATLVTSESVIGLAVTGSYLAVVGTIAIAASDYRSVPKAYFKARIVTSHFKQVVPASVALRATSEKSRLAA